MGMEMLLSPAVGRRQGARAVGTETEAAAAAAETAASRPASTPPPSAVPTARGGGGDDSDSGDGSGTNDAIALKSAMPLQSGVRS